MRALDTAAQITHIYLAVEEKDPPRNAFVDKLRGFGPVGLIAFLVIALVGPPWFRAILVLLWAFATGTPWRRIGLVRPASWPRTIVAGLLFGIGFKLILKTAVMPLLGAPPTNRAYQFLVGNTAMLPAMLFLVIVSAGVGEELVFRGYLFERLGKLFGHSTTALILIVLLTSAFFALAHYREQGAAGAEQAFITGMVFGTIFACTWRLPLLMIAHAAFDITAVLIIYYGVEIPLAHLFFK